MPQPLTVQLIVKPTESMTIFLFLMERFGQGGWFRHDHLYREFAKWCQKQGLPPISSKEFTHQMARAGLEKQRINRARWHIPALAPGQLHVSLTPSFGSVEADFSLHSSPSFKGKTDRPSAPTVTTVTTVATVAAPIVTPTAGSQAQESEQAKAQRIRQNTRTPARVKALNRLKDSLKPTVPRPAAPSGTDPNPQREGKPVTPMPSAFRTQLASAQAALCLT